MKKFLKFWFPVILYSGIIFSVSSLPNLKAPLSGLSFDKVLHIFEYIPFGYLVIRAIDGTSSKTAVKHLWLITILISFLYGVTDEVHQMFVEGRFASVIDLTADTIGGAAGGWIFLKVNKKFEHKEKVKVG